MSAPGESAIDLPDGSTTCACGMTHRVAIEEIVVESDAIERLAAHAVDRRWRDALLVMDANTREVAGDRVAAALDGAGVRPEAQCFEQRSGLLANEGPVETARAALRRHDPAGVIAVGSGVLTDIARYASFLEHRSFVSVPTAASMDGYASGVAAMEFGGVKVSFPASAPQAIFADPGVVADAPAELTRAGLGDLLGKASARTDWRAAHLLYGEPFCEAVEERVLEPLRRTATDAQALMRGERDAVEQLLVGLLQSGIAMAMMGSSRPASGCEHHASHFWDLLAARGLRSHQSHGLQVGYATHFAMRLQRYAFGGGVPALVRPRPSDATDAEVDHWLGDRSPALAEVARDKQRYLTERSGSWPDDDARWSSIQARLAPSLELFDDVRDALSVAEIPAQPGYLGIDGPTLRATFRYANRLRARYTALDFLEGQGKLDDALDAVLDEGA